MTQRARAVPPRKAAVLQKGEHLWTAAEEFLQGSKAAVGHEGNLGDSKSASFPEGICSVTLTAWSGNHCDVLRAELKIWLNFTFVCI